MPVRVARTGLQAEEAGWCAVGPGVEDRRWVWDAQSPLSGDSPREGRHRRGEQTGRTVFPKAGPQGGLPLGACLKHWLSGRPQPC